MTIRPSSGRLLKLRVNAFQPAWRKGSASQQHEWHEACFSMESHRRAAGMSHRNRRDRDRTVTQADPQMPPPIGYPRSVRRAGHRARPTAPAAYRGRATGPMSGAGAGCKARASGVSSSRSPRRSAAHWLSRDCDVAASRLMDCASRTTIQDFWPNLSICIFNSWALSL